MPSIDINFLRLLQDNYRKYNCFIETGTYNGQTIMSLEPYFDKLYTIEVSEKYYKKAKNVYFNKNMFKMFSKNKIDFIHGDSSIVFSSLLSNINTHCIFFLDGHWSGGDTGRSEKDCPLTEEITHINNLFTNEAIIIIDDFRLFGLDKSKEGEEDWSKINKDHLLHILQSRVEKVYHLDSVFAKDDRLVIHIKSK